MPQPMLLDQVRSAIRLRHYSIRTEEAYVNVIRRFILYHRKHLHACLESWRRLWLGCGCFQLHILCLCGKAFVFAVS